MNFAFVSDGSITEYPVGATDIRRRFPNTCFPASVENADLSLFGAVVVADVEPPSVDKLLQRVDEAAPVLVDGAWQQAWTITDLTSEEIQAATDLKAASVRVQRDELLAESDWTVLADSPLTTAKKTEWKTYRTALRDITAADGFPYTMTWPTKPS